MGAQLKDLDMEAITAEYERGDSLPVVAQRHGVDYETIRRRLKAAGVPIRSIREGLLTHNQRRGDLEGLALDLGMPLDEVRALLIRHGVMTEPQPIEQVSVAEPQQEDDLNDAGYQLADRLEAALGSAGPEGLTVSLSARKAQASYENTRHVLAWMAANQFAHNSGTASRPRYHKGHA